MAAGRVLNEGVPIAAAGGVEQISMVQMGKDVNLSNMTEKELFKRMPALWMTMIETAEIVADRYQVSRESQDEFALLSQQRTAAAQEAGLFADEIVPLKATWKKVDRETKEVSYEEVVADRDDCNRPDTTLEGLASLKPVFRDGQQVKEGKYVTAGNASQFSDGASACVVAAIVLLTGRLGVWSLAVGVVVGGLVQMAICAMPYVWPGRGSQTCSQRWTLTFLAPRGLRPRSQRGVSGRSPSRST